MCPGMYSGEQHVYGYRENPRRRIWTVKAGNCRGIVFILGIFITESDNIKCNKCMNDGKGVQAYL